MSIFPTVTQSFVRIYTTATAEAVSAVFCTLSAHPYLEPRIACFLKRPGRIERIANQITHRLGAGGCGVVSR